MEPLRIEAVRTSTGTKVEAYDAAILFEQAGAHAEAKRFREAVTAYDRLVAVFPSSRYVVASLYNAGLALERERDFVASIERYRRIVDEHAQSSDVPDALFRMGGCQAELGRWADSAATFARLLGHGDLALGDRIEAMARRGLAQFQLKDIRAAERTFRDAIAYYREHETQERLESDFFLAMCQFYLGEVAHEDFRALPLRLPQRQLEQDLEAKAEQLLTTQARYVDTARIRNAAWATAAGYQMATLYKEFYDALLDAPLPDALKHDQEMRQIYFEELKKKIEPLLRKAIHAHELTQGVAERSGVDNEWVRKSSIQLEQLRALLTPGAEDEEGGKPPSRRRSPPPARPESEKMQPPAPPPHEFRPRILM